MFPRVTHPSATPPCEGVRLACVKPAASVRSEPGSNSQVVARDSNPTSHNPGQTKVRPSRRVPNTSVSRPTKNDQRDESENVTVGAVLSQRLSTPCQPLKASRKDPAVHVSLSSDAIVKQRGTRKRLKRRPYIHRVLKTAIEPGKPCQAQNLSETQEITAPATPYQNSAARR